MKKGQPGRNNERLQRWITVVQLSPLRRSTNNKICPYGEWGLRGERGFRGIRDLLLTAVRAKDGRDGDDGTTCDWGCKDARYCRTRTVAILLGVV